MSTPDLSILILGYNQCEKVMQLLRCIEKQRGIDSIQMEVIYSDDGSTDDTIETLRATQKYPFPFRIIESEPSRKGRAASRNRAALNALGKWLLFLDGDGEINNEFVSELWKGKQPGAIRQSAIRVHPRADCPARRYEVLRTAAYRFGSKPVEPRLLQSGCFLMERELFSQFGGFDEQLRGRSGEDVEFGARLAAAGVEVRAVPSAQFSHNHARSIEELIEVKRKYAAQGLSRMVEKNPEVFRAARLHWLYEPTPPYRSPGFRRVRKWLLFHLPVKMMARIANSNVNFWWCGRTIIPLLAFYGTMRGFNDYLTSGTFTEEEV